MTTTQIVKWATGFAAGVTAIVWVYGTFLTREANNEYIRAHEKWGESKLSEIHENITEIKADIRDIRNFIFTRKTAAIITNLNLPE